MPFTDNTSSAGWRRHRYLPFEFVSSLLAAGAMLNPILQLPGFALAAVVLDWLHVVDLGLGQDILGNQFYDVVHKAGLLPGSTIEARVTSLWVELQT
jgi:hypothetical protein